MGAYFAYFAVAFCWVGATAWIATVFERTDKVIFIMSAILIAGSATVAFRGL